MTFSLVNAKAEDAPFVRKCARLAYAHYVERMGREPAPMIADFEKAIAERQVDILNFDAQQAGYAITFARGDHLFVENVAILPALQGKGLAGALFKELENRTRSMELAAIELYTNEKMLENLGLYTHLGFKEIERRIEDGFHRVYFRKTVN